MNKENPKLLADGMTIHYTPGLLAFLTACAAEGGELLDCELRPRTGPFRVPSARQAGVFFPFLPHWQMEQKEKDYMWIES